MKLYISVILFATFLFTACSEDNKKNKNGGGAGDDQSPPVTQEEPIDLSSLPLEEALKTKYSKLIFSCSYEHSTSRTPSDGVVVENSESIVLPLWNILEDFKMENELGFEYDFENVRTDFEFTVKLRPNLYNGTYTIIADGDRKSYSLTDAVSAEGSYNARVVEDYADGPFILGQAINHTTYQGSIPNLIYKTSFGPGNNEDWTTGIDVQCYFDTEVNSGFENDSSPQE